MKTEKTEIAMRVIRLKNRRVALGRLPDGSFGLHFRALDVAAEKGQRVRTTRVRLSPDAMDALVNLYMAERGVI